MNITFPICGPHHALIFVPTLIIVIIIIIKLSFEKKKKSTYHTMVMKKILKFTSAKKI